MLISKKQLKDMVLYSYAHIDRLENPTSPYYDPAFPRRIRVGNNRIGYLLAEVERYIERLVQQRDNRS